MMSFGEEGIGGRSESLGRNDGWSSCRRLVDC